MLKNQITSFDELPESAFLRESQLVKSSKRNKAESQDSQPTEQAPSIFPFSSATLWRRVADGSFPKPVKLSTRVTAWRVGEIREFIKKISSSEPKK